MRCLLLLLAVAGSGAAAADGDPLAEHEWRHRLLLFHAPAGEREAIERFRERIRGHRCGVDDRDLVIGEFIGDGGGRLGERRLDAAQVERLRRRHGVDATRVTTTLVGKDGGVKMRVQGVAELQAVFARIDGMPMRRREMAERGAPDCD